MFEASLRNTMTSSSTAMGGLNVGDEDGLEDTEGFSEGMSLGFEEGSRLGILLGTLDGKLLGCALTDGVRLGPNDGCADVQTSSSSSNNRSSFSRH